MSELSNTQFFQVGNAPQIQAKEILEIVYKALREKGYNPVNQIVGYIMSGDPIYITSHNGFPLADLVSYDGKHNEANGENNQDGPDYNYSWNCGAEGATRRKAVLELRKKQMRNAFFLFLMAEIDSIRIHLVQFLHIFVIFHRSTSFLISKLQTLFLFWLFAATCLISPAVSSVF